MMFDQSLHQGGNDNMNRCIKYVSILIILMTFATTAMAADTADPVIHSITLNDTTPNPGDPILVTVSATDDVEVTSVSANSFSLTNKSGLWNRTLTAGAAGTHYVNVAARDAAGNVTWDNTTSYTSTVSDITDPVIHSVTLNDTTPNPGDPILVTVSATDNVRVTKVSANGLSLTNKSGLWNGTLTAGAAGTHYVNVAARDAADNIVWDNSTSYSSTTSSGGPPVITPIEPSANPKSEVNEKMTFEITVNQTVTIKWYIDGIRVQNTPNVPSGTSNTYENDTAPAGVYNVTVFVENMTTHRTASHEWIWTVTASGHSTGFRIWDANREPPMDLNYTWTARSYTGFYYDIDDDISTETLTIQLDDYDERNIKEGNLQYITTAADLEFEYNEGRDDERWGSYKVIGFMAEKYFAGYEDDNTSIATENIRLLSKDMLSKVLIDEDEKHMISTGASLKLKEDYELKIIQLDIDGGQAQIDLMKDGKSVDSDIVTSPDTYVYTEDIRKLDDVPLVAVHIDNVFAGTESDMLVIDGIFQISDDFILVDTGEDYGEMEIQSASSYTIKMENSDDIELEEDEIVDIMGNLKFLVADNETLRFALYEEITEPGTHDIRGTVYDTGEATWNHMNFEGFYYNIHDDLGTETLMVKNCDGNNIPEDQLIYETTAESVEFDLSEWGSFDVVGFMAEPYFAGYTKDGTNDAITNENINLLSKDMLSKVLIDVEDDRMISTGASLQLEEDYELKVIQLDVEGGQAQLELLKNGKSVDTDIVQSPDTYVYTKDLGKLDDVPLVVAYIDNVFAGTESDLVTIKGVFQISDDPISIDSGDTYGEMEITGASGDKITMKNKENDIDLDEGETTMIMENIGFTTSDDGGDRYYLFVRRTIGSIAALKIELPEGLIINEDIVITITADGSPVEGVEVQFAGENMGLTDSNGKVTIRSEEAGTFTIIANKENYDSASREIRILTESEADMDPLEIEMLDTVEPGEDVVIKVSYKGDDIDNASISWDGDYIGDTDETGSLTYTAEDEGTYTVTANKDGYLEGSEEIEVAVPSAEFELEDLTFPDNVSVNKEFTVSVDVTNTGNADGTYLAELKVNDSVVDSQNVTLDAGDTEKIEFTTKIAEAGTFTIEIGTESGEITVTKPKSNTTLIAVVLILLALLGAIGYLLISSAPEGGWTVGRLSDAIKDKFQRGGKGL
ncbi:MAG: hypothetical protein C4B59_14540 [Candidatus Methanogaster sp.]|uniref:Uncharacterized protein n=1 Tax=Candidatus Methanogaster sp. TaxID=3386292 RepID=A0AC61KZL3_9EURY|nr:MAG: hypothetical protein C4B59_14540 [ANME-2 cluster archaeon]